jgi:type VI secretion system protein ImpG
MDPQLLKYYNRELQYIREMGAEFAREFPKIGGRLGIDGVECADPYVERLLEGFSFLAARIQLKLDAEFPRFTQHLLEIVYPHFLCQLPSMAVTCFQADLNEGGLADGFEIPRGTALRSILGKGEQTACEYRTTQPATLWPLKIAEAEYFTNMGAVSDISIPWGGRPRAGLRLRLQATAGLKMNQLALDTLQVYLQGRDQQPMRLYEQLVGHPLALALRPVGKSSGWNVVLDASHVRQAGFDDADAMLPYGPRSFSGYRLLQEYFAFPERYRFVQCAGLQRGLRRCEAAEIDLLVLFDALDPVLENKVGTDDFVLFCAPAINLFPKRADRIHLANSSTEYHIVPDRTRPMDFEVYQVMRVEGHGTSLDETREFLPFYACNDLSHHTEHRAFYTLRRERRTLSSGQRRHGPRTSYIGNECFISLVDTREAPYSDSLKQLSIETLCTNRDLPLQMPVGKGDSDFTMDLSAPVGSIRCVKGPTRPGPSPAHAEGEVAWKLINHLSLNYLSLMDDDQRQGAAALREMLSLYADKSDPAIRKQVEGVRSVSSRQVTRRIPVPGPISFGRGLEVTVEFDDSAFEGSGIFLLGSVLERFFARYVSINSFTETIVRSHERGEVMRWPVRIGQRQIL